MLHKNYLSIGLPFYSVFLLLSISLFAGCKGQEEVETHWSVKPIEVDGDMADWTGIETAYFEDNNTQLGLCNDSDRLYVLFRFSNQTYARLIRMGGLTLWLDNTAQKKKEFGLRYSGGPLLSQLQEPGMDGEGGFLDRLTPEQQERLQQREIREDQITVLNTDNEIVETLSIDGRKGPAVAYADLKGIYTYEFSIPLRKTDLLMYGLDVQPGQALSLGLEWGLSDEQRRQMMEQMGGGMGEGRPGGGMGGGGRVGGGMRGGPGGMGGGPQMPDKQEIWVKTVLASVSNGQEEMSGSNH